MGITVETPSWRFKSHMAIPSSSKLAHISCICATPLVIVSMSVLNKVKAALESASPILRRNVFSNRQGTKEARDMTAARYARYSYLTVEN